MEDSKKWMGHVNLSACLPFKASFSWVKTPPPLFLCWHIYISHSRISMTVTVTNLSVWKKKKEEKRGSTLFYSGGAQPENSILRQQWCGKYLSKGSALAEWNTLQNNGCLLGCLADCQEPWAATLLFVRERERKGDGDTHHHQLVLHRCKHWCEWLVRV